MKVIKIHVVLHFGCWGLIKFIAKDMLRFYMNLIYIVP